jgi:hypothetical protein
MLARTPPIVAAFSSASVVLASYIPCAAADGVPIGSEEVHVLAEVVHGGAPYYGAGVTFSCSWRHIFTPNWRLREREPERIFVQTFF